MRNHQLEEENRKLRAYHGSTGGRPNYRWEWSDDLRFPVRDEAAGWDYVADPDTGLIKPYAVYRLSPMCPHLRGQWVLCRFLAPPPETAWKDQFGPKVEYPAQGYYAPTNAELDPGINPWDTSPDGVSFTDAVLRMAQRDRDKKVADWDREAEDIVERRDSAIEQHRNDLIDETLYTPFGVDHVEGKRGGPVSIGGFSE